jgi:hypothetical protein
VKKRNLMMKANRMLAIRGVRMQTELPPKSVTISQLHRRE